MTKTRSLIISLFLACPCYVTAPLFAESPIDPAFEKPTSTTMAALAKRKIPGVAAVEVSDYTFPGYSRGEFHADCNPRKAVIIRWGASPHEFVFAHEASYCPLMFVPSGLGLCNQFFEGNLGWGELFNNNGRKERNSFVDIVQSGPRRAWVRWNYLCVNMEDDRRPCLRGVEDYIAYPNGLVWRRLCYESLMPDKPEGYSWQPIDFFSYIPPRLDWSALVKRDAAHGDYQVAAVLDAASDKRYDLFWSGPVPGKRSAWGGGLARRTGDAKLLQEIARSPLGFAMVMPAKGDLMPFIIFGHGSGFAREKSQLADHSAQHADSGGWAWGNVEVDHWPVGWINSQCHVREPDSPYPYHICPMSHYLVSTPMIGQEGYNKNANDMELNRWSEKHVYYAIQGVGRDFESIRALAKAWLKKGARCADPGSVEELRPK